MVSAYDKYEFPSRENEQPLNDYFTDIILYHYRYITIPSVTGAISWFFFFLFFIFLAICCYFSGILLCITIIYCIVGFLLFFIGLIFIFIAILCLIVGIVYLIIAPRKKDEIQV